MKAALGLVAVILLIAGIAAMGTATAVTNECDEHLLYVSGMGQITTDPDRAIVSLAVETEHANVKTAQQENAIRMNQVTSALKAAGITSEDLETTGYNIYLQKDPSKGPFDSAKEYYHVTNTLLVTLKDINKVGEVIDVAIANGANRVNYISFTLSDEKQQELRSEALADAVRKARNDADAVTAAMGLTIRDVKEVSVGGGPIVPVYAARSFAEADVAQAVPTPIEAGTIDVTASVSITYLIG